jgi:hypothetical protein
MHVFHNSCLGFLFKTTPVFPVALNETPNRLETWRMRSGVRFMMRAASSNDFDAFASSITRRSEVILTDANGLELGTVKGRGKPLRTDQARHVGEECARDQREILKKLRKSLN